jgi:serine/threonine-protein kinase RsbW
MSARSASASQPKGEPEVELFRFVMPSRLEYRDAARAFLAYICGQLVRRNAFPEDVGHRVISAFIEAFNNAVIHAYKGIKPGSVEVELEVSHKKLSLRIIDEGHTFKPEAVPEPDLDALPEGGMGLYIMRSFMDSVEYQRVQNRNVLTMEKALSYPLTSGGER